MAERETNTELAERGYRAWNEDDLEGLLAICHPEVTYHTSGVFPGLQSVYEGKAGITRWWADFHEPWSEIKVIPERIVERPDGVAILIRFEGTGRQGIETTMSGLSLRTASSSASPSLATSRRSKSSSSIRSIPSATRQ